MVPFPEPHGRTLPTRSLEAEHSWREGRTRSATPSQRLGLEQARP